MKKLFAILLSMLLLCSMIPFATVAATEEITEPTLWVSTLEANAGDEIAVEVKLLNNPGVIAAVVEVLWDKDVMDLVIEETYDPDWDEYTKDNKIELAAGWPVNFITPPPLGKCGMTYINGTATRNVTKELFFTAYFKIKDDAPSGTYPLTLKYDPANFFNIDMVDVAFDAVNGSVTIHGTDPEPPVCTHEYDNACDVDCNLCGETREVEHNVNHVEAKDSTCTEMGNIEHWYCDVCGTVWLDAACTQNTNMMAVKLPMAEHEYFFNCDTVCVNCGIETRPEASHSIVPVEPVESTCIEMGNIAYWYCSDCGCVWADEDLTIQTNMMSVKTGFSDHTYDGDYDTDCNVCGAVRVVTYEVITFGDTSVSVDVSGLAFKFCLNENMTGLAVQADTTYKADYSNAYVAPDSTGSYKLVKMGAVMSNNGSETTLDNVNGTCTLDIVAENVVLEGSDAPFYAIRIIHIPETNYDTIITARPYYIYENTEGEQIVVYGEEQAASFNSVTTG